MFNGKYLLVVAGLVVSALCSADAAQLPHMTRKDLIGAWRLVDIEVNGPAGREADPFYGNGSRGLVIYDASGWFSVQIEGSGRPAVEVPSVRPSKTQQSESTARLNAAALDSYYAYFGTWTFDPATSTVTHHAKGALYPSEDYSTYAQHVDITGHQMLFVRTQTVAGHTTVQTKRWERVSAD